MQVRSLTFACSVHSDIDLIIPSVLQGGRLHHNTGSGNAVHVVPHGLAILILGAVAEPSASGEENCDEKTCNLFHLKSQRFG